MLKILKKSLPAGSQEKGYVILIVTFFVLIIMLSMAISMSFLVAERQKRITDVVKSTQSYYAAEAGIEDAILRLKKYFQTSAFSYILNVDGIAVNVDVPSTIGISKTVTSEANKNGMMRKVKATCSIDNTQNVSFYYGAEVGEGGLIMSPGSVIMGNVFSNGNISGSGTIDNDAIVSGNGHSISGVYVKGNAQAYSCLSGASVGNLTYVEGGGVPTCTIRGTTHTQTEEILQQPLPIPQETIDEWKNDAAKVPSSGSKTLSGNQDLGPIKITGNLNLSNNTNLTLKGVVYVQGNIIMGNNVNVKLSSSYNTLGGVIIADGTIDMGTGNTFSGSGQPGSYVIIISTNTSDSAISIKNNSTGAVFYTSAGGLSISNNVSVTEATGYKVIMQNNSKIQYSSGIVNIYFSSGPGGGWKVTNWQEY